MMNVIGLLGFLCLCPLLSGAQIQTMEETERLIRQIEADTSLTTKTLQTDEVYSTPPDGEGTITLYVSSNGLFKMKQVLDTEYGRHDITLYFTEGYPCKIIDQEYYSKNQDFAPSMRPPTELAPSFKSTIYVIDRKQDWVETFTEGTPQTTGTRPLAYYDPFVELYHQLATAGGY